MEIPEPPKCPPKLHAYLVLLRQAALTARPIAGSNCAVQENVGSGTVINANNCPICNQTQ